MLAKENMKYAIATLPVYVSACRLIRSLFVVLLIGTSLVSAADDASSRKTAANELFSLLTANSGVQAKFQTIAASVLDKFKDAPAPAKEEGKVIIREAIDQSWKDYQLFFVESYAASFTEDELRQLVIIARIFQSPLMAKFQKHQASFKMENDKITISIKAKLTTDLTEKMKQLVAKYAGKKAPEPTPTSATPSAKQETHQP